MPKTLITSALIYANGPIHFGHLAGSSLPSDIHARFCRLRGDEVLYVSGSDEYGLAVSLSAELAGRSPKEHVDHFHQLNHQLFKKLHFSYDKYSRTSWEGHIEPSQQFFNDLVDNGYIEPKVSDHLYSEKDKRFLADRYVEGTCPKCGFEFARGDECPKCGAAYEATDLINPRSKLSGAPLCAKPSKHWFLCLEKFKDSLKEWLGTKGWKSNVTNFIKPYIDDLRPRAITRDTDWGIKVPLEEAEGKVLYVWFDAPIGYISASMQWAIEQGDPDLWKKYWCDEETRLVQFLGKDNIPFHAVIFPAMTMGQKLPLKLVDELPANEFYNLEGKKLSKSAGWYIDLESFLDRYEADQLRYMIAATAPETSDSEFNWKEFQVRTNSELVGKWGNFIHRTLTFINKHAEGKIPLRGKLKKEDEEFLSLLDQITQEVKENYSSYRVRKATQKIMELAQVANIYFDTKKPWVLSKSIAHSEELQTTLSLCLEAIKRLSLVMNPVMPDKTQKVWEMLGQPGELSKQLWDEVVALKLSEGTTLNSPKLLFTKLEDEQVNQELEALEKAYEETNQQGVSYEPLAKPIEFPDFQKIDIRAGEVLEVQKIEKSKKLLLLKVNLGFETRQIVSGIAQFTSPEELIGKRVLVLANLKPAKLMGYESQGMLLVAEDQNGLEVISLTQAEPGAKIS